MITLVLVVVPCDSDKVSYHPLHRLFVGVSWIVGESSALVDREGDFGVGTGHEEVQYSND